MAFNNYYKEELIALRTEGAEFSRKNPGLSTYLSKEGQDPDVERLLEGFSFLTGRLKQQLNQELPEVAHSLVQLLWPHYVRPVPSYSIIQFESVTDSNDNIIVNKGFEVQNFVQGDTSPCRFQTSYDTTIMPIDIYNVEYYKSSINSILELDFKMTSKGTLDELNFDKLKIHLSGSKFVAMDLYLFLTKYILDLEIIIKNDSNEVLDSIKIDKNSITTLGFNSDETILPKAKNVFDGYILLQEFFCFKEKFLFVNIDNINKIQNISTDILRKSNTFTLRIKLKKSLFHNAIPTKENFSLYCTPILNLYETDSIPIRKKQEKEEFLVLANNETKNHTEVFSILSVRGWVSGGSTYQDILPFESFDHNDSSQEYYSPRVKLSTDGQRTNTYLRFSQSYSNNNELLTGDSIMSVRLLATNKNTPSKLLLGDICISNATNIAFRNITIPSVSYPPPIAGDFLWRVISNMSLNYLSLNDLKTLKTIISTYDFFGAYDAKQKEKTTVMLEGIISIESTKEEYIHKGMPIRGMHIHLVLDPLKFACVGEAYLFCSVINEFFSLYGNINSFHRLTVDIINEDIFSWDYRMGTEVLS